jgi:hypothetical protein
MRDKGTICMLIFLVTVLVITAIYSLSICEVI